MSREKQIEEMAEDLMACHTEFYNNAEIYTDYDETAKEMYAKGYRKQSEVAREIFEEIGDIVWSHSDAHLIINRKWFDEIKKKYTGG